MKQILAIIVSCLTPLLSFSNVFAEPNYEIISDNCNAIRESLKSIQHADSRARVYLGGHFETIFGSFIKPLNHRLIENNFITPELVSTQTDYANKKAAFSNDFITYQKSLENLLSIDCKAHPNDFYAQLENVRTNRAVVKDDVDKLKNLISDHYTLVQNLELKP